MPEAPEVQSIVDQLRPCLVGMTLRRIDFDPATKSHFLRYGDPLYLANKKLDSIDRRAKYIIFNFKDAFAVIHLGMTGALLFSSAIRARPAKVVATLEFEGETLSYVDPRTFGKFWLFHSREDFESYPAFRGIGVDFIDVTLDQFKDLVVENQRMRVKDFLLSQRAVAGIGNIYANEILFHAKVHPLVRNRDLTEDQIACMYLGMKAIMGRAIAEHGTSIEDFILPTGDLGQNAKNLKVFQKQGQPCPRKSKGCIGTIVRVAYSNRGNFICPVCQKEPE